MSYTKPTSGTANTLADADGNATGTFTDKDVIHNAPPLAPARPIVAPVPRTTDSLTVDWSAPDNTNRPDITSYDVHYSSDFGETWTDGPQDVSEGPVTLTDLVYGESFGLYLVQVRATNTAGDGPWSESARETLFPPDEEVAADLGLVPAGPRNDDRFRLLFITHATNTAESDQGYLFDDLIQTDLINSIVLHWTFLREADSDDLASNQRALLSTPGVDARVRTDTTFTAGDKGVPIYWLRGSKVADDYEDFYDGSWDDVASPRNSRGAVVTVPTQPWTGSSNDGTESRAVGQSQVGIAGLGSTTDGHGPLSSGTAAATGMRPLFGLTHVYVVRDDHFLLSNMAQAGESGDKRSARRSQRFTTGSNPGGYALDSVTVSTERATDSPKTFYRDWSVSIYTVDASGHPATEHTALTAPDAWHEGRHVFTAPAGTTLLADTTYAVVVIPPIDSTTMAATDLELEVTTSNGENERSASDWSIFDAFDIESGSSWSADTGGKALYIAVRGAPVPDKPTGLSAIPSGSDRINLSWTAPSMDGGSAITGYQIEVSSDGGTNWTDLVADTGSTTTTHSHTGLSVGDTRHYRVSAISINGTGPASDTDMATIASTATGAPAITPANAFRVPGVLTANKGSIADADGLPLESTFTWQWVQVDGMTETDIVSATSQTYTLTATDVGKKIKVKASFTDTGTPPNAEGPLTSAAYPSSGSILPVATDCLPPTSYPGGAAQIWTGRVTIGQVKVQTDPLAIRGYLSQSTNLGFVTIPATDAAGTLSNTTLAAGSQYTIKLAGVSKDSPTQIANNTLLFATTPAMTGADQKQLTLYVCDQAFPLEDTTLAGETRIWTNTGLDWNDQAERTLYISRDQTVPTVSSVAFTGTTLTLTFNEDLGTAASLANSAFEVKKTTSGGVETTVTLSGTPTISGRTLVLTMGAAPGVTDTIAVTYTKPTSGTANKLVDKFGNEAATFTKSNVSGPTVTSIVRQTPTSSPTNADELTWRVTFSEAVSNVDNADFSVDGTTATLAVSTVTGATGAYDVKASGGNLATLNAKVTLRIATGHNIQDTSSNALINTTPTGTNNNIYVVDNTAPTLRSATVNQQGDIISLVFSEGLDGLENLALRINLKFNFAATAAGTPMTFDHLSYVAESKTIHLVLSNPFSIRQGAAVSVSYTDPTSGDDSVAVEDAAGNETASFTTGSDGVPAVTNNSSVPSAVPGPPTSLRASASGTTGIDLSWTAPADDGGRVISGYKIEVSTNGGTSWTVLVANTGSIDTTYAHSGLTAGSTRHYRVSAINTIGASAASNTANANTPNTADHRPTSSTSMVTATEDTTFTFSGSNFAFFDNDAGATLVSVKITALLEEGRGTLALDGTTITSSALPRTVTKAELDAGKLIYTPPNNWNGYATFRFKVNDGSVDSASAYTMLVLVTSVNDLPTSSDKTVAIIKGDAHTFEADDFAFTDVEDRDTLTSVKITTLPIAGTLTLRGVAIAAADLPKTVTKNDLDRDRLRFVPADNASGANFASFKFKVNDGTDDSASAYTLRMSINKPATGLPTITGMAHVGATLTADTSGIKDEDGLGTFTYQWISNNGRTDTDIADATGSTYELVEADERKTIKVKVSFTDKIGNKENLTSPATGRVATRPNRLPTGKPAITGTPRVGETLTASTSDIADADGLPNTFRYRWKRFTLPGAFAANIGSNSNTYILTSSDIAMQMKLEVSYIDGRGAYETLISDAYPRRNGVEPAPTPSNDCAGHSHLPYAGSFVGALTHWHPCLELIRPVAKIPLNYDGDLTLGVEKTYTHGVTYIPSVRETDRSNVTGDKAIYRIRLEPGQKYRFTVRRDTIGGDSFGRYGFGIGHLQTTCVDIFGCDHHGGVEPIHLDKRTTNAPLVHPGALTSLTEKGMNYSEFFQEFQTPCLPGSPDACGPALLNNYDYPNYYYAVVEPASGAAAGERVHLKVERLPSTHVLADSPLDDQYAWQRMGPDKDGKSGYVLNFIGASMGMWNGATVSGYLDDSNDVDMHHTFRTANRLDCKITPAGLASGTPAKAATNLKIKTEDGLPRDSIDSVTLDPFSYVEVYSTTGDTGGYQITASECVRDTTYYAERGVVKRNQPTELVVGRWLTAELEEPSSEAVTVTAEDNFDLIKFGRGPDRSNWTLKPGEAGLVEYSTNLHKITLNAGTSYNMKRRGDLRNDLAISIVRANDSCDDQRFISGSGDFIQYDAEDENDGSEFTPILHYSALNTRSDTDTATGTGTGECYIITVDYLHGHNQKFGPYSILVTEN